MKKLLFIFCFFLLAGCASMTTQIVISEDNFFTCTNPSLEIQIDKGFKHITEASGKKSYMWKTIHNNRTDQTKYENVFLKFDEEDKALTEAIIIRVIKTSNYWDYNKSFRHGKCAKYEKIKFGIKQYRFCGFLGGKKLNIGNNKFRYDYGVNIYRLFGPKNNILVNVSYYKDILGLDLYREPSFTQNETIQKEYESISMGKFKAFRILY